jgi:signal transduction histidine kinase
VRAVIPVVLRPVRTAASLRRAAHLLVGGALALALAVPVVAAVEVAPLALLTPLALVAAGTSGAVRALERAQADALLGTALPGPAPASGDGGGRWAVAWGVVGWLVLRAVLGAAGSLALVAGVAAAALAAVAPFEPGFFASATYRSPGGPAGAWMPVAGLLALLVAAHLADALGRLEARAAPRLLGPSAAEEVALLRARTGALAERERLARELHDGVGHAVTVTLLQARAASRVLDRDPGAARAALAMIEEISRATMEELDRVLALLRREGGDAGGGEPGDLAGLGRALRAAGLPLELDLGPPAALAALPVPVRSAVHRIVQEAATNVLRHAGPVPTRAEVRIDGDHVVVRVRNAPGVPLRTPAPGGTGRGLDGLRERARALGGEAAAGPAADGGWVVEATLPVAVPA